MSTSVGRVILRANAVFLLVGAVGGMLMDVSGVFFATGPLSHILERRSDSWPPEGIGFIEAHGLALIVSTVLWRAAPTRSWHATAAAVEVLLATANLVFWNFFIATASLAAGYITTTLHIVFVVLQGIAAIRPQASE